MPIDYSKFDRINCDEDEEDREAGRNDRGGSDDFAQLLQQCLQNLGDQHGDGPGAEPPWAESPALMPSSDDEEFSRSLDWATLRGEAWRLLCTRLVVHPSGVLGAKRAMLLEAEFHVLAGRYRQALVAALALQLATSSSGAPGGPQTMQLGGRAVPELPGGDWALPASVIEMVSCYQLGDRGRALELREVLHERLQSKSQTSGIVSSGPSEASACSLSQHLQRRFEGTSEVLELVPELMNLLRAAEAEAPAGAARR